MDSELMIWQEGITMVQRIMSKHKAQIELLEKIRTMGDLDVV